MDSSGNLLLACAEALCTSRVGGSGRSAVLVPRDLKRPLKISTQKIQNTLTDGSEHLRKCRSTGVLPRERGASFNSTCLDCLSSQETRD